MTPISTDQFERARRLALQLAGIELFDRHREILSSRRTRIGIGDDAAFGELLDAAESGDERAGQRLVGLFTTNFTRFFRHPEHFSAAADHALAAARRRGFARIWSAAASTGEEPYSAAIAVLDAFGEQDPPVTVLATDIDDDALDVASRGEYGELAISTLDEGQRCRHFVRAAARSPWIVSDDVRRLVTIRRLNLIDPDWPDEGPFDVIFSRNVLMYLEARHRETVTRRMADRLAPGGLLILDPAEHIGRAADLFVRRSGGLFALHRTAEPHSLNSGTLTTH